MKRVTILTFFILVGCFLFGQKTLPQIDQTQYNATYRNQGNFSRTKQPEKTARKLPSSVTLNGYLTVYNEDIGYFLQHPIEVIEQLNAQKRFGRDNWRIPTPDELCIMEANATTLGLGSGIYMCTKHANGYLRPVSTDVDYSSVKKIGNTYWTKANLGASNENDAGVPLSYQEALDRAPKGYRLPTREEALSLIYSGEVRFGGLTEGKNLFFPYTEGYRKDNTVGDCRVESWSGYYWIQGGEIIYFWYYRECISYGVYDYSKTQPEIRQGSSSAHARYVLDK